MSVAELLFNLVLVVIAVAFIAGAYASHVLWKADMQDQKSDVPADLDARA